MRRWWLVLGLGLACTDAPEPGTAIRIADYLEAEPYRRLVIEVDVSEGLSLAPDVVEPFVLAVSELVDKPEGVELIVDETLPASDEAKVWTFEELDALAEDHFNLEIDDDTAKVHVLLLDGSHYDDEGEELLGLAWGHRNIALFQAGLHGACASGRGGQGLGSMACRSAELGVLAHEFGHVVGLVNNGLAMVEDHEDPDHPGHTSDPNCLMYWAYERRAVVTKIQDDIDAGVPVEEVLGFCAPSLADVAAYR